MIRCRYVGVMCFQVSKHGSRHSVVQHQGLFPKPAQYGWNGDKSLGNGVRHGDRAAPAVLFGSCTKGQDVAFSYFKPP